MCQRDLAGARQGQAAAGELFCIGITEPDAGTNTHNITTTARRDGDGWVLNGRKIYISGVDEADHVLDSIRETLRTTREAGGATPLRLERERE